MCIITNIALHYIKHVVWAIKIVVITGQNGIPQQQTSSHILSVRALYSGI